MELHGALDLGLQVVQIGDGGRRDVGDLVGHGDARQVLALAEGVARLGSHGLGGGGARGRRRGRRALHAGVHVGLVVVTDEEHVVVAFEHARQAAEADVDGPAVAGLADDPDLGPALHAQRRGDAGGHGGSVAEQRMQPGDPPRGLGVGSGEHLQAAGRVHGDYLARPSPAWRRRARSARRALRRSPGRPGARSRSSWSGSGRTGPCGRPSRAAGCRRRSFRPGRSARAAWSCRSSTIAAAVPTVAQEVLRATDRSAGVSAMRARLAVDQRRGRGRGTSAARARRGRPPRQTRLQGHLGDGSSPRPGDDRAPAWSATPCDRHGDVGRRAPRRNRR